MAEPSDVRLWRERVNALREYVYDCFYAPVNEGYRMSPLAVQEAAEGVEKALAGLEGALRKIDHKRSPVGGELALREERGDAECALG